MALGQDARQDSAAVPQPGLLLPCLRGRFFFLSQWLGEGYSDVKPTAWKSPQPSQPAEPLRKDPRPKEWDQLARSDFHYKTTQRRREEEKKSPTATEKGRTERYRMVLEVAVSTLHVGGSDVWVASLLT